MFDLDNLLISKISGGNVLVFICDYLQGNIVGLDQVKDTQDAIRQKVSMWKLSTQRGLEGGCCWEIET